MKATDSHMVAMGIDSALAAHSSAKAAAQRPSSIVVLFVCLTVTAIAGSIAGLAITFPATELVYEIEAVVPSKRLGGGGAKQTPLPATPTVVVGSDVHGNGGAMSTQPVLPTPSIPRAAEASLSKETPLAPPGVTAGPAFLPEPAAETASVPEPGSPAPLIPRAAETPVFKTTPLVTPEPPAEPASVPIGTSLAYEMLFTDEYPAKDVGILCKNLPGQSNVALASSQCAVSCARDKRCRYFWATVAGRCCLKAAYDTTSAVRAVAGKDNGQFCMLTARGPAAAEAIVGLPPPQVQQQEEQQPVGAVEPTPPVVLAPTVPLAGSSSDRQPLRKVAVIILGQMRSFLTPKVQESQRYLVAPLQHQFGAENVHLYLCADPGHRAQLEAVRIAGAVPTVFEARSRTMFAHMATCYQKTVDHAASMGLVINWFVRSRFDTVFFDSVPPLFNLAEDTVYARARRIGNGWKNVDNEQISYWMWGDVCGDRATDFRCVYRDTKQVDGSGKCMIMDDQFAYVPAAHAQAYFGTSKARLSNHFSVPATHTNCMWPEGELTCRVLSSGAKLEILRVSARLDKFTTWGACPSGQSSRGPTPAWLEATRGPMVPSHICHPDMANLARAQEIERKEITREPNWANLGNCARTGRRRTASQEGAEDVGVQAWYRSNSSGGRRNEPV